MTPDDDHKIVMSIMLMQAIEGIYRNAKIVCLKCNN